MKLLVYGAGVTGSLFAARLHEAGHDVSLLARGGRLAALRRDGVQLAEGDSPTVRRVPVPVVEQPAGGYDLTAVFVRTHQVDAVLESLAGLDGDVLFLLHWAAGAEPLGAVIGPERVLLSIPTDAGTMDGDVVRYRPASLLTRRVPMPIGEPDGRTTPRLERVVRAFRTAGINAKAEPQMEAWLRTAAAFTVPVGQAAIAAGGPRALADDPAAVRAMIRLIRHNLATMPTPPVPRGFGALQILPQGLLAAVLRRFLRGPTAAHSGLNNTSPADGGGRTRAVGRTDARQCEGPVGDPATTPPHRRCRNGDRRNGRQHAPRRRRSGEASRGAQPEGATAGLEQVPVQHVVEAARSRAPTLRGVSTAQAMYREHHEMNILHECHTVDVVRAYSKRLDLLDDLGRALRRLQRIGPDGSGHRRSVQSAARRADLTTVRTRLGQAAIDELVACFRTRTATKHELAKRFGISLSSVKRVLRKQAAPE